MDTKVFVENLKNTSRVPEIVGLRLALCSKLYDAYIPVRHIAEALKMTTRNVYYAKRRHKMLIEANDQTAIASQSEVERHNIRIKPVLVEVNDSYVKMKGVAMVVDNVFF